MKKLTLLIILLCVFSIMGCSPTKLMSPEASNAPIELDENTSRIIFYRSSALGSAIQAPIAEYVDGDVKFVSILSWHKKSRFITTPGKHIFVVGGESGSIIKTDIAPGKNYYIKVSPYFGWWKARFKMTAIRAKELETEDIKNDIMKCELVTTNDMTDKWFQSNKNSMKAKAAVGLKKFEKEKDKSPFILNKEDGIDTVY